MDWRVVIFTTALAVVTALAFGLVPALRATRLDLAQTVKEGANSGGYQRSRLRNGLVVVQVAASVAMLALSGVFVRASQRTQPVETADNAERLLTVPVNLDLLGYTDTAGRAFQSRAIERLGALPGVEAVALAPFAAVQTPPSERVSVAGDAPDRERWYQIARVGGDWFSTRNLRPIEGRLFTLEETRNGAPVAVLNQAATSRLWPGESAIGKWVRIGEDSSATVVTVVGVIPATRRPRNEDPAWLIITPAANTYSSRAHFYVRTSRDAAQLRTSVLNALQELDARLPVPAAPTLRESLDQDASGIAQIGTGVGAMGTIALLLAALGLSAVLSFVVEQRRYEIGVRIALGARSSTVTWLVLRQSLGLSALGIVVGAIIAGATAILLRGILFGLPPIDPVSFAGSTAILLVVALLSSAAPARRAAGVDPATAMRGAN
jgi:predicted permease